MNESLIYIFLVLLLLIGSLYSYLSAAEGKQRIRQFLTEHGAKDIHISRVWFDGHGDTHTYAVRYTDAQGQTRQNSCKINARVLEDDIYWKDPI